MHRTVKWVKTGMCKRIKDFTSFLEETWTTLSAITKAYAASRQAAEVAESMGQQPYLITRVAGPAAYQNGYKVITTPVGSHPLLEIQRYSKRLCHGSPGMSSWASQTSLVFHLASLTSRPSRSLQQWPYLFAAVHSLPAKVDTGGYQRLVVS
ncbi:hypothetical protein WJX74_004239 [Apatococcus lobatus]|uniref:Uncharacterized protein n=1 Tax=Apatococcus lobatus TaxID=904363 RepID=A0AAW1RT10_9CHLO